MSENTNAEGQAKARPPIELKPGYLVALSTSVRGGVMYKKKNIPTCKVEGCREVPAEGADFCARGEGHAVASVVEGEAAEVSRWETLKVEKEEHKRASKVRERVRGMIAGACVDTPFGLMCQDDKVETLDGCIAEAQAIADAFNASRQVSRVDLWCVRAKVIDADAKKHVSGIAAEIKALVDAMDAGVAGRDADKIRDAASKARKLGAMLDGECSETLVKAVAAARAAATALKKRGDKAEETLTASMVAEARSAIDEARFAFLDVDVAPVEIEEAAPDALDLDVDLPSEIVPEVGEGTNEGDALAAACETGGEEVVG